MAANNANPQSPEEPDGIDEQEDDELTGLSSARWALSDFSKLRGATEQILSSLGGASSYVRLQEQIRQSIGYQSVGSEIAANLLKLTSPLQGPPIEAFKAAVGFDVQGAQEALRKQLDHLKIPMAAIDRDALGVRFADDLNREYREKIEQLSHQQTSLFRTSVPVATQENLLAGVRELQGLQDQVLALSTLTATQREATHAIPFTEVSGLLKNFHRFPLFDDLPHLKTLINSTATLAEDLDLEFRSYLPHMHDTSASHRAEANLKSHIEIGEDTTAKKVEKSSSSFPVSKQEGLKILKKALEIILLLLQILYISVQLTPEQLERLLARPQYVETPQDQAEDVHKALFVVKRELSVPLRLDADAKSVVTARVHPNTRVEVQNRRGSWIYVMYRDEIEGLDRTGWIHTKHLKPLAD